MDEQKTFTQEELNRIISERVAREQAKQEELAARLQELMIEHEALVKTRQELEAQTAELPKLKRDSIVAEVALELGLPSRLIPRLRGESKEEIVADATALMADLEALKNNRGIPRSPEGTGTPVPDNLVLDWLKNRRV